MTFTNPAPLQITDRVPMKALKRTLSSSPDVLQPRFASWEAPDRCEVAKLEFPSFWNVLGFPDRDISSVVSFTPHFSLICLTTHRSSHERTREGTFYISRVFLAEPAEAAAALMAPATSSAFLITEILHLSSVLQESDVPLAFIFSFGGKSVFWTFQHSPMICRCLS